MQSWRCLYNARTQAAEMHYCSSCTGPVVRVLPTVLWEGLCTASLLPKHWAVGLSPRQVGACPAILKNKSLAKPQYTESLSSFLPAPTVSSAAAGSAIIPHPRQRTGHDQIITDQLRSHLDMIKEYIFNWRVETDIRSKQDTVYFPL